MNYVDPIRGDLSVTDNEITYTVGYYATPTLVMGVTDETYEEYNPATTYIVDDFVIISELKGIYRSSDATNVGNYPPANPNVWTFWSPINSYNMLAVDEFIGSQTTGTDVVLEFDFSQLTAFSLIDIDFGSVLVEQIDTSDYSLVYSETISGVSFGAESYYEYFYEASSTITRIYRGDLEWTESCILRLTFTGAVSIGATVVGLITPLGCTLEGTSLKFEDTSTISKSEVTGFRTVTRYGNVRVLDVKVKFDIEDFNSTSRKIESIIGKNILFVPTPEDNFSEMITIGYFEDFKIPIDHPTIIKTNTSIIGVI